MIVEKRLSQYRRRDGSHVQYSWYSVPFSEHPALGAMVADCIGTSSLLEAELARVVAEFSDSNPRVIAAMWGSLGATHALDQIMKAAIRESLVHKPDFETFKALIGEIGRARRARDRMAHGLWAVPADNDPADCIILVPAGEVVAGDARWLAAARQAEERFLAGVENADDIELPDPMPNRNEVFVYDAEVLASIQEELMALWRLVLLFARAARNEGERSTEARHELCRELESRRLARKQAQERLPPQSP